MDHCTYLHENESDTLFKCFVGIFIIGAIFFNTMQGYIEATALNFIKSSPGKPSYGAQRIFGSIGGCLSLYFTGFIIDRYPLKNMSIFSMAFFLYAPYAWILAPLVCYIIAQNKRLESEAKPDNSLTKDNASTLKHMVRALQKCEVIALLLTGLVAGSAFVLFVFFTALLLEGQMKVTKQETSFLFITLTLVNLITFPFTGKIIKLLRGPIPSIVLGMVCHGVRHIVMSYTSSYWIMLSVQLLHCFDFALLWSAMMEHMGDISPPQVRVTMTLVLTSVKFHVSPFILNTVGGVLYQKYGGKLLFRWNGVLCLMWAVLMVIFYTIFYNNKRTTEERTVDEELLTKVHA